MQSSNLKELFFSQSALGTYQNCHLKFRRRYIEGLYWPGAWSLDDAGKVSMEQGRLFHLLAQRLYSVSESQTLVQNLPEPLQRWFDSLVDFRPPEPGSLLLPEQELRLQTPELRLVAKYDLLYLRPDGKAIIYDWKTTGKPPKREYLERHLQTIVYRYVLCAAGEGCSPYGKVVPENVTSIYWNPQYPLSYIAMPYSTPQFHKDEKFLKALVREIGEREFGMFLATTDERRCHHCEYSPICQGERAGEVEIEEDDLDLDLDWESIDEIGPGEL